MRHRSSLFVVLLLGIVFADLAFGQRPPNVLIVTVDDMSCDSVGVFGCKLPGTTPNMDELAKSGLRFQYAHVQVGNCMPSRNVMWSGRYPHNNGVEGFYQVKQTGYPVLCDLAKEAGYFTAIRHKISHSTPFSPYAWDLEMDALPDGSRAHVKDAASYGESTRRGINAARSANKPFCLLINIADPHKPFYSEVKGGTDPHVPSQVFNATVVPVPGFLPDDPIVRAEVARYYSSVRRADDGLGEVLKALRESGEEPNTVVLFLSDHGMPLPFAKTQLYHHSTHTPLMVRWPNVTRPNTIDQTHMVSAVDFLPTLVDIMGLNKPEQLDGRSFAELLHGEPQADRDCVIKEYNENSGGKRNPMRAIETRDYLYIFNPWSDGSLTMATATNGTDSYKRMKELAKSDPIVAARIEVMDHRTVEELYHVASDPDCMVNLILDPAHQAIAESLRDRLLGELQRTGDPIAPLLLQRDAPEVLARYMQRVQAEADARRATKRPKKAGDTATSPGKKYRIFSIETIRFDDSSRTLTINVQYAIPSKLEPQQKMFLTLKNAGNQRIERKEIAISGKGNASVSFKVVSGLQPHSLGIAAFVGEDFQNHLQHVQAKVADFIK